MLRPGTGILCIIIMINDADVNRRERLYPPFYTLIFIRNLYAEAYKNGPVNVKFAQIHNYAIVKFNKSVYNTNTM